MSERRIYKYPIRMSSLAQETHVFKGGIVRHVGKQDRDTVCLWIEVDILQAVEKRVFRIVGTGDPIRQNETHRGTVIDGRFVWHVVEAAVE